MAESSKSADESEQYFQVELRLSSALTEKSASAPSTPTETTKLPHSRTIYFQPRKGRRVCFPNDDLIVTGYFDAPDPWSQVCEPTTEDLVSAYELACKKQSVTPFQSVLQQLREIASFDKRYQELSFRGLKLEHRHCEALEEIFKRVQFIKLSFEACNLDDDGAAALFDMIEYYESAKQLNISFNKRIDSRGWQACSRMLKKTPCMEYLEAHDTPMHEQSLLILGRALRLGARLVTLHLENCGICGRPLVVLVAAIKLNTTLKELYLSDNKISSSDGIQIANLLRSNSWLKLLDLHNNNLQDSGSIQIFDSLCDQQSISGTGLSSLILWTNNITHNAMAALGRCLVSVKNLSTLNVGHNCITNDGIHHLKQGLITSPMLQHLGLQHSKITCEGAVAIAEYIADSKIISRINLMGNRIAVAGLLALVRSMKHNQTVTRVSVDGLLKKEFESDEEFDEHVKLLQKLEKYCQRNRLRKEEEEKESALLPNGTSPEPSDPIPIGLNRARNVTSFESYFENSRIAKHSSVPSLELKNLNLTCGGSPRSRFTVSRVFLEKDADARVLSSSAPADVSSEFVQTAFDHFKSSVAQMNGVVSPSSLVTESESSNEQPSPDAESIRHSRKNSKKLTFNLPESILSSSPHLGTVKDRRMSTPAMPVTSRLMCQPNPMKLCKHLESLDLRSSVPLSPTRLMQGWVFPEPTMESRQDIFCTEEDKDFL